MNTNFGNEKGINGNWFYMSFVSVMIQLLFYEEFMFMPQTLAKFLIDIAESSIKITSRYN